MARTDSLSIQLTTSGVDKLAEEYGKVIENVQHQTLADRLKNKDLSGDPTSGSLEAKRFANIVSKTYGTARTAGSAQKVKVAPVTVPLNDNLEYLEEIEEKDLMTYGVDGLIERRTKNHGDALAVDLDKKFFAEAINGASEFSTTETDPVKVLEEAIQKIETTKNSFVQGVPRNKIRVIASPEYYGKIRNAINIVPNSQGLLSMANYEEGMFNNAQIFSSVFLPTGTDFIVMAEGSVAQPVRTVISNPEFIQLSKAVGFGLFVDTGVKNVSPDIVCYQATSTSEDTSEPTSEPTSEDTSEPTSEPTSEDTSEPTSE